MSEINELNHIADLLKANGEFERLRSLLSDAVAALEEAAYALDNYADVDIIEGHHIGNTAMRIMLEVQDTLAKIKRAIPPPPVQEVTE